MRDELIQDVLGRITRADDGDAEAVLAPDAEAAGEALLAFLSPEGRFDFDVLHVVGTLHLARSMWGEEPAAAESHALAETLLAPVFLLRPDLAPPIWEGDPAAPEGQQRRDLGSALVRVGMLLGNPAAFHVAVNALSPTANDPADPFAAGCGVVLAAAARLLSWHTGDAEALTFAQVAAQRVLDAEPTDATPAARAELARALLLEHTRTGDQAVLDRAVEHARQAPPDDAEALGVAAMALALSAERAGDRALAREAVALGRDAVAQRRDPDQLVALATTLHTIAGLTDDDAPLVEITELLRPFLDSRSQQLLYLHGSALFRLASTDPAALDETVAVLAGALAQIPPTHPDHPVRTGMYAEALWRRWKHTGDRDSRDAALAVLEGGTDPRLRATRVGYLVDLAASGHDVADVDTALAAEPDWNDRAALLGHRYDLVGDRAALVEAIALNRAHLADPDDPEDEARVAHNAAMLLRKLHDLERTPEVLADALALARRGVTAHPAPTGQQAERVALLALLTAEAGQVEEGARLATRAVADCPPDHPNRSTVLSRAAEAHFRHYDATGARTSLDTAIAVGRAVLAEGERAQGLDLLAVALRRRAELSPDLHTLDEAVDFGLRAVEAHPFSRIRASTVLNLAGSLADRYRRTRDVDDLHRALRLIQDHLGAVHPTDDLKARLTDQMGVVMMLLYQHTGEKDTLRERVRIAERGAERFGPHDPTRPQVLNNLSSSLMERYFVDGDRADAEKAVTAAREAVALTPAGLAIRGSRLLNLSIALGVLGEATGTTGPLREALRVAEASAGVLNAPPATRIRAHRVWGRWAVVLGRWRVALAAFAGGVDLVAQVAPRHVRRADRESRLADLRGVHTDAAAAALATGDPIRAVELLEQARGVLLVDELDARAGSLALRDRAPHLATEWDAVLEELADESQSTDERQALSRRWQDVLDRIRAVPGLDSFLRPPSALDLRVADGAIVLVNISQWRCDALLITSRGVRSKRLRHVTLEEVEQRTGAYLAALDTLDGGDLVARFDAQAVVRETLAWLWDTIAGPVLKALGHTRAPRAAWPRVWWCPTGALTHLPLHAAGRHDVPGEAVLDRVVSSYTPTARTLNHTRSRPPTTRRDLLAVAMPTTPDHADLPATDAEATDLAALLAAAEPLRGPAATRAAVLAALPHATWAHFACHAHSDPLVPSAGHLLLADGALTVADIGALRLENAELAYLSACSTARTTLTTPDEVITLASAFQLAGFRHVVGALWPIQDTTAARVAATFHRRVHTGTPPAEALHEVLRELRTEFPLAVSQWAGYVHVGS
ncbi:CHAT domain-containing protein [Saccharothrix carnea]|uniref:CHAT domain-containing protein n=1 Tax=Saccharothrix carnea TaxID=1280637 RepID=A0A2P8I126_SACCR|nr:CHAT domain-containing protein [Saccharothrix carnea]PSL52164.1 CHAT domain-containing protein [Saccharothrix carnea]